MIDRIWNELRYRWRALARRDQLDDDLRDELAFHLEQEARKLEARGHSPAEARRIAGAAFGAVAAVTEGVRDVRGIGWVEQTWADLRHACRSLAAHRLFAAGVVGALALGIGANVTVFGIVDRLMFRAPTGLRHADRVHRVHLSWTQNGDRRTTRHVAVPRLLDFQRGLRDFDLVAGFQARIAPIGRGEDTREGRVAIITPSYLEFFDAPPALGRWFTADDDSRAGATPGVVLGYAFWQTRYGGRADVLGTPLQVDRLAATIIGVAPLDFDGLADSGPPAVFVPVGAFAAAARGPGYERSYNWSWVELLVRRKADVTGAQAAADLTHAFHASWAAEHAARNAPAGMARGEPSATLGPVHLGRGPDAQLDARVAVWISGVAALVFLVACANVANLFLARAVSRQRDMALRLALGAGRGRLASQLGMESLILGILGGLAGVAVAWGTGGALRALLLPAGTTTAVVNDVRTVAFTLGLSIVAGALTALVPAFLAARLDVAAALKGGGRGTTRPRTRTQAALVVVQAALSVVLLVGAFAFVLSVQRVQAHRLGFDVDRLLYAEVNMRGTRLDDAAALALASRLEDMARSVPGVTSATIAASVPFWSNEGRGLVVAGVDDVAARGRFTMQAGSTDYFLTTGTRILRGRGFTPADSGGGMLVMVVSDGMARVLWPGRDALGQCVRVETGPPGASAGELPCRTVVGVAEESAMMSLEPSREFSYYLPVTQMAEGVSPQFFIRAGVPPDTLTATVRDRLQPLLPGAAYVNVVPLADLVAPQYRAWQAGATVFVAFGVLALLLAAVGLHSLVAYEVAQREQEFGVRVALGASRRQVLQLVLARGTRLVLAGVAVGLVLALSASGPLDALMFHQSTRDPRVLAVVAVVLVAVASLASLAPGLRATRVDPTEALRAD